MSPERIVRATAPARLDFAGGWSDTPPICFEHGGTVVNAAVALDRRHPIEATARRIDRPAIIVVDRDADCHAVLETDEQLRNCATPGRCDALPAVCLRLALAAETATNGLPAWLGAFGGIHLTVSNALPHGAGLGGSSILAATILACLSKMLGQSATREDLVSRTLHVEQLLTTGGGWQDQVGAIYPGVKLTRTRPGNAQTPSVESLPFDESLADHLLLYYTGITRLAKNILVTVVGRYQARDPEVVANIEELKTGAIRMSDAIKARDQVGFGRGVLRYWQLKKRIDPGSTTPAVEGLISRVEADCLGYTLLGAGGGGFLLLVARDTTAVARIREGLSDPPAAGARFFDFSIDDRGLDVSAL